MLDPHGQFLPSCGNKQHPYGIRTTITPDTTDEAFKDQFSPFVNRYSICISLIF